MLAPHRFAPHRTAARLSPVASAPFSGAATFSDLATCMAQSFRTHAAQPAFICAGKVMRYAQLDTQSQHLAHSLLAQGLTKGSRVAVMLPNLPQLPVAVAAVLRAGLAVVMLDPALAADEVRHVLRDSGARALVLCEVQLSLLAGVVEGLPLQAVVSTRPGDMLGPLRGPALNRRLRVARAAGAAPAARERTRWPGPAPLPWAEAVRAPRKGVALADLPLVQPDDMAVLQYTSGTTGPSRGVVLLHRHLVANLQQAEQWMAPALKGLPAGEQWVTVGALPLHHIFGFTLVLLLGLAQGHCTLLVPDPHNTDALLRLLARHRFHGFPATDPLFHVVASHPDVLDVDWRHLRLSLAGATAVQPATAMLWLLKTGRPLCQGYGLAEASPAVTCNPVDDLDFSNHLGLPLPGTELKLLDDQGQPVEPGTLGEIAVRGPQVMAGYWQRPEETARVMSPDGFLRTGDMGVIGPDGALRLVDRKEDLIFVSGFNVYPSEIEAVVAQLPGVQASAAVGVPDALMGEQVKLVVARTDPALAHPTEAELRAHCERHLAGHKRPRLVEFRDMLPTGTTGKVLRRQLRGPA